jgi:hypothetical protein
MSTAHNHPHLNLYRALPLVLRDDGLLMCLLLSYITLVSSWFRLWSNCDHHCGLRPYQDQTQQDSGLLSSSPLFLILLLLPLFLLLPPLHYIHPPLPSSAITAFSSSPHFTLPFETRSFSHRTTTPTTTTAAEATTTTALSRPATLRQQQHQQQQHHLFCSFPQALSATSVQVEQAL